MEGMEVRGLSICFRVGWQEMETARVLCLVRCGWILADLVLACVGGKDRKEPSFDQWTHHVLSPSSFFRPFPFIFSLVFYYLPFSFGA